MGGAHGSAVAGTPLSLVLAGSLILGLCSLAMPAMTEVVVGTAGPERAGLASAVLNAARQAGGAFGVAAMGSLLGARAASGFTLHAALPLAAAGYASAACLALIATRRTR